ncbi:ROK family transcriptional regulator [Poseidonocella sedimentorum]|uniref:Sugar kinase of the NBD/HSP70 family, may contain an N-terminal HTH domain n=1 Tax=Poseidonocella sedimentorum TaxID=871652 RepID=A0A1I6D4S2_9RHOB|nr:ROK family transcriptional regulator [Poseidonocella sedimentorum]SFR00381.1 Sugar kinase of the NBD/HSP70 family, may contain an N-terminal HTH domain [Poseidonocella sedimentorum]
MDGGSIDDRARGVSQRRVRDHNERLLLTMLQRHGGLPGADLARKSGLSPQTVSNILRKLEKDGILARGTPRRGKVGKPSIPMELNPDGVLAFGLKLGRRSADLVLLDFVGTVRGQLHLDYAYPMPAEIFAFLERGIAELRGRVDEALHPRICGIGIGTPFELWRWHDLEGDMAQTFVSWKDVNFAETVARFSALPCVVVNDSTAACHAEHLYGAGTKYRDHAYFFIGSFIGGGVVLNDTVFEGNQGNAGALGSMRSTGPLGESRQLIDVASIHQLETRLVEAGLDRSLLWRQPQDWSALSRYVDPWIGQTAQELAKASLSICSVIDFEAILIDGAFPSEVRDALVERVRRYLVNQDTRGLISPRIEPGSIGENARAIGAASSPIFAQFFLNANAGLSVL